MSYVLNSYLLTDYQPVKAHTASSSFVSVLDQEIGWEERLRHDLFCVEWDVKP